MRVPPRRARPVPVGTVACLVCGLVLSALAPAHARAQTVAETIRFMDGYVSGVTCQDKGSTRHWTAPSGALVLDAGGTRVGYSHEFRVTDSYGKDTRLARVTVEVPINGIDRLETTRWGRTCAAAIAYCTGGTGCALTRTEAILAPLKIASEAWAMFVTPDMETARRFVRAFRHLKRAARDADPFAR